MSLSLDQGTIPAGTEVSTLRSGGAVALGSYEISLVDFLAAAYYVLTNTDLTGDDDPRLQFTKSVGLMHPVPGYNAGGKRLESPEPPLLAQGASIPTTPAEFEVYVIRRLEAVELPPQNRAMWWDEPNHFIPDNLSPREAFAKGVFKEVLVALDAMENATYA